MAEYAMFEGDGFSVESNTETAAQLAEQFGKPEAPEDASGGDSGVEDGEVAPEEEKSAHDGNGEPKKANPRKDLKARALQAAREATQAKREAAEYRQRLEALEQKATKPAEPPPPAPKDVTGRPKLDDFETIEDHAEAVAEWVADKRDTARKETERVAASERTVEARKDQYADRMEAHIKSDPDFWLRQSPEVLSLIPISNLSPEERAKAGPGNALAEAFLVSENPSALIEYFRDEKELNRVLSSRTPLQFHVELQLIERGLGAAITDTAPVPESSKAAPPARPVTGGPPIGNDGPSEADSDDDYIRKRNAQERKKRSR